MRNKISSCYSNTGGKKSHPLNGFWRKSSVACEGAFCYSIKGTKGTALERSDIDIAVSGVGEFDALLEEVEEIPTLYTVDLLDMDTCGNGLLLEDIRQYGRKI